jgi:ABC-2 type transport system permease protein
MGLHGMSSIWTLATKDLRLLTRDRVAMFWVLGFPLLFALFFGSVMKAGLEQKLAPLPVVFVDQANNDASELLRNAFGVAGLSLTSGTLTQAQAAVRTTNAVGYVRVWQDGLGLRAELGVDKARPTEAAIVEAVVSAMMRRQRNWLGALDVVALDVKNVGQERSSGFSLVFPAMILWALLGCAATFAVSMVVERTSGTLIRLRAAPITRSTILAGKAMACLLACLLSAAVLTVIARTTMAVRIDDALKLTAALASTALCFSGITVALSVLGKTEQSVAGAGWATLIVMAMLGGAMIPLALMPKWLLLASDASPVKWGILALEGASFRAFSWAEIAKPLLVLLCVAVASFGFGMFKLNQQRL